MKQIKKYAGLLLMLTLLVGFTSCEDDEDLEDDDMEDFEPDFDDNIEEEDFGGEE